jgi:protein TonB
MIPDSGESGVLPEGHKDLPIEPKSFLFDEETIEKYARNKPLEIKEGNKGLSFDAPELMHRGYMRMLKDKIENIWKYPAGAAHRGISGDLYIKFSIQKDGRLGEVQLVKTSGFIDLDEAAMKALQEAAPYWPLPDDWEGNELPITGHFIYFLGGAYIL